MSNNKKPPSPSPELRQRIYTCIDKLSDRATLSQAITDLQTIIQTLPSHSLTTFLTCILSIDSSSKTTVRVHCLNLLSLLSQTHPHFLSHHVTKTIAHALLARLRDNSSAVRAAVVNAVSVISPVGFGGLVGPLLGSVLNEKDSYTQIGSCLSLKAAVDSVVTVVDDVELLRKAVPKMVKMVGVDGFKGKAALLGVIGSVVRVNGGGLVCGKGGLLGSVIGCVVELLGCDDWAARKAAAEVLEVVALVVERGCVDEFREFVVNSLETRRFDKVKITRETMNRALDVWKDVDGGPKEETLLSSSNSSISKEAENGNQEGSTPRSRRSSFAGLKTPKPKKTITKTRLSFDGNGFETSQRRKTTSKSNSSSSDESTVTDSSMVSKSSQDGSFRTPQLKKPASRRSSSPADYTPTVSIKNTSLNGHTTGSRKSLDLKLNIALSTPVKVVEEDDMQSQCDIVEVTTSDSEASSNFFKKNPEEMVMKVKGMRSGSRVVPFVEEDESQGLVVEDGANEEVGENNSDFEELSLIRNQLLQMERQQSNLLDLVQKYMGNSQNGIDSLETRVSGLERAIYDISNGLNVRSGRIPSNDSTKSSCCPSTEFLSPKFWRKTEGRSSISKSYYSGNGGAYRDGKVEALQIDGRRLYDQKEGMYSRNSWRTVEVNTNKSEKLRP